jgi:hypothetical protein
MTEFSLVQFIIINDKYFLTCLNSSKFNIYVSNLIECELIMVKNIIKNMCLIFNIF